MLVSGIQQSDSVIHIYIVFQIIFHYRLLLDIEYSSLCYTVAPCVYLFYFFFSSVQHLHCSFFLNFILFYLFFYTAGSYQLSILYIFVYTCQSQSPSSSHHHHPSLLLYPLGVHTFVLYICVSISALLISSSVPFFQVPHTCVNI